MTDFSYDAWPSLEPYSWAPASRGTHPDDQLDFHVDLGCGRLKKGRIGVDRHASEGVNVLVDFDGQWPNGKHGPVTLDITDVTGEDVAHNPDLDDPLKEHRILGWGLPFPTNSIESIVTHHALEHVGTGFINLMDECYRVLKPGGAFRIIVPLFPSLTAVSDADHKRNFMANDNGGCTLDAFCGSPGDTPQNCWLASFSVPYTRARFKKTHQDITARSRDAATWWTETDARELRVTLEAVKENE